MVKSAMILTNVQLQMTVTLQQYVKTMLVPMNVHVIATVMRVQVTISAVYIKYCVNICTGGFHDCHSSASCAVAADSYTCTCIAGYIGDGKSCVSEDECSDAFKYEDLEAKFKQLEAVIVT